MSAERLPDNTPEKNRGPEVTAEHYEKAAEKLEKMTERSAETAEAAAEKAKAQAMEQAISSEQGRVERKRSTGSASASRRRGTMSKKELETSFDRRMSAVRDEMSAPERAFSKFIHAKPVEKASAFLGATVARPNAILSGAVIAFVAVLAVYLIAKNYGYPLSGFETIGAFVIGWAIGVLYDFFRVMVTGKKS